MKKQESKLEDRSHIINFIYLSELSNKEIDTDLAFESGDYDSLELKKINNIAKNYAKLRNVVTKFTKEDWPWTRIAPLERAILIYGAFELSFIDKALVINELVIIAQGYIPGESYKFINSILDKVGEFYEQIKKR